MAALFKQIYRHAPSTFMSLIAAASLVVDVPTSNAAETKAPSPTVIQKGVFILATDSLTDVNFAKSVIYVTEHGEAGTYGLIINKPTYIPVNDAMPENKQTADPNARIFFGGPVHAQHLFILTKAHDVNKLHPVTEKIYFGAGERIAIELNSDEHKNETRTFMGFASWTQGQLDEEIKKGMWLVIPGDDSEVMDGDPKVLWSKLFKRWSGKWI